MAEFPVTSRNIIIELWQTRKTFFQGSYGCFQGLRENYNLFQGFQGRLFDFQAFQGFQGFQGPLATL